jgi:5-methylcytosine-specific restriction endonuclease McrA
MAKNTNNRIPVKWIRDKAKAAYQKQDTCYVCNKTEDLELHHLHSITVLLNRWSERKGYDISTDDGILAVRDEFIAEHNVELYDMVYTLCNPHHVALHGVYGKAPAFGSEERQRNWIEKQKAKAEGKEIKPSLSLFGKFL